MAPTPATVRAALDRRDVAASLDAARCSRSGRDCSERYPHVHVGWQSRFPPRRRLGSRPGRRPDRGSWSAAAALYPDRSDPDHRGRLRSEPVSRVRVALGAGVVALVAVPAVALGASPAPALHATLSSEQQVPIAFNQGIARVNGGWIVSGTNSPIPGTDVLARLDDQLRVVAINQPAIPTAWRAHGYDHIGDIDVVGNVIYAPFEEPDYTLGHQATARYDATTLRFIDAVVLPQHQNSFVAVDPATMIAYTQDEFGGTTLLRYDVAHSWRPLAPLQLSVNLVNTQGASVADGAVWISTSDTHNDIYRADLASGHVDLVGQFGHPGGEGEGIDASSIPSGQLHGLVIDPTQTRVWFEHFRLSTAPPATPPAAPTPGSGASGVPTTRGPTPASAGGGSGVASTPATGVPAGVPLLGTLLLIAALAARWVSGRLAHRSASDRQGHRTTQRERR